MPGRRYHLSVWVTDKTPGWKLANRVVPQGYTIRVEKYYRVAYAPGRREHLDLELELTADEVAAIRKGDPTPDGWVLVPRTWLELDVVSSPTEPFRCVALRAPGGISTPEQRFPLVGIVTEATATIASKDGSFTDLPRGLEYEDTLWEAGRARGRKRPRRAITPERLEEVAQIASENPRTPTAAVQHRFGISRGYARKLIKLAETS
jgi:hypothetical protein